jgi:predicted transcriptional regulator
MQQRPAVEQATNVGEVMTRRVVTIGPHHDLVFAHNLMMWGNVRHLPVVQDGRLVGVISDRDLLERLVEAARMPDPTALSADVMRSPPPTARVDDDLGEAAARMAAGGMDCLVVVDDDRAVLGILTTTDVLAERGRLFFKGGKVDVPSVATVMRTKPKAVTPDLNLLDAIALMVSEDLRHLPVVDADRRVVGMLSDRDVRAAVGDPIAALREEEGGPREETVEAAMTPNPVTIAADASIFELASCLLDERVGAVVVVDERERLVGIVSYVDLLRHVIATRR